MKKFIELNEDISALLMISTVPMKEALQSETSFYNQKTHFFKEEEPVFIETQVNTYPKTSFDLVKEKTKLDLKMKISFLEREISPLSIFKNERVTDSLSLKLLEVLKKELNDLG